MSTYYSFYAGKQKTDGTYEFLGPYVKNKDGEIKIEPLFWRSRSFIKWDEFDWRQIPVEQMGKDVKEICAEDSWDDSGKKWSIGYWISYFDIAKKADGEPIRGYVPVESARALIDSDYDLDFIEWEMERPLSAEVTVGMTDEERSKYSFVSYNDTTSTEWQCYEIQNALGMFEYNCLDDGEAFGVIVQVA